MIIRFPFFQGALFADEVRSDVDAIRARNEELETRLSEALCAIEHLSTGANLGREEATAAARRVEELERRIRAFERILRVAEKSHRRVIARTEAVQKEFKSLQTEQARLSKQVELDSSEAKKNATAIVEQLADVRGRRHW